MIGAGGLTGGDMSSDDQQQEPVFEPVELKDGSGYFVRVTWPDGYEQQINDFADEQEARTWIDEKSPHWHEWAPHRVQRK